MAQRKTPQPFGEMVQALNLDALRTSQESNPGHEEAPIPEGLQLSSLLSQPTVKDFTDGMLRAVKELNQNPELLREVSKRIS